MSNICADISKFVDENVFTYFSGVGMLLNGLCIIGLIFSMDLKANNLFKYLVAKSLNDFVYLFDMIFRGIYKTCVTCFFFQTYEMCTYGYETLSFIYYTAGLLSMLFEIAANFDRYRVITGKFKFMDKCPFWIKIISMIALCSVYHVFFFFSLDCKAKTTVVNNVTQKIYKKGSSWFGASAYYDSLQFVSRLSRDIISCVALIVLNVFTMLFMTQHLTRKRTLTHSTRSNSKSERQKDTQVGKAKQAKLRTTQMVLISSFFTLLGHLFKFVDDNFNLGDCFGGIASFLLQLSYAINFLIFMLFLEKFRNFFIDPILKALRCVKADLLCFCCTKNQRNLSTSSSFKSDVSKF